jgi:hypothetical protein
MMQKREQEREQQIHLACHKKSERQKFGLCVHVLNKFFSKSSTTSHAGPALFAFFCFFLALALAFRPIHTQSLHHHHHRLRRRRT